MLIKKITNLLGIAAIGLMMGSSVSYAVKGYGLLGASGDWARLIASNIASSSSSSSSSSEIDCNKYDLTKFTCKASETWTSETHIVKESSTFSITIGATRYTIGIGGDYGSNDVSIVVKTPACEYDSYNVCNKSHVINNKPVFSTTTEGAILN